MTPLFTHPVANSSWLVVVTQGAGHFYYDRALKVSVWQKPDDLGELNYDDLGVLFAKANGMAIGESTQKDAGQGKKPKSDIEETDEVPELLDIAESYTSDEEERTNEDAQSLIEQVLRENNVSTVQNTGLLLGYSLDSDMSEEEGEEEAEAEADVQEDGTGSFGIDLDLDLEPEDTLADLQNFKDLLETHKSSISPFDPWFMVEEGLLSVLVTEPAYYALAPAQREQAFNDWVKADGPTKKVARKYPTAQINFYKYLQEHKAEVKKKYYSEFRNSHPDMEEVEGTDAEMLYRKLKVTLSDFSAFERANKAKATGNLKVEHVKKFLAEKLNVEKQAFEADGDNAFDRWMDLCNHFNVPETVANDPTNFILGDEKRFTCYEEALTL